MSSHFGSEDWRKLLAAVLFELVGPNKNVEITIDDIKMVQTHFDDSGGGVLVVHHTNEALNLRVISAVDSVILSAKHDGPIVRGDG